MLQNDEALYYGKPHRCYITPKSLVIIGVISINFKVIILFFVGCKSHQRLFCVYKVPLSPYII